MRKSIKCIFILSIVFNSVIFGQMSNEYGGAYLGFGSIKGNSPVQSSLAGSIIFGFNHNLLNEIGIRFGYTYARKVNYFLPENSSGKYYPFLQAVTAKAVIEQSLENSLFVEEGIGLCAVNDRTFSDVDEWAFGIAFSAMIGWDLRNRAGQGYRLGFIGESALTVTSTTPTYFLLAFQTQFYF